VAAIAIFAMEASASTTSQSDQKLFSFDEQYWVLFYDLPSRRFNTARSEFVKGNFESAKRNIRVTESHLRIEASRASVALTFSLPLLVAIRLNTKMLPII
jgi:hypothetical protein